MSTAWLQGGAGKRATKRARRSDDGGDDMESDD